MKYVRALDGLRGIAVLLVLWAHFPSIAGWEWTLYLKAVGSGLRVGYLGVDIFFVLSGFLITSILLGEKRGGDFSFRRFYLKRTLRIFPIFYFSLMACWLLFPLPDGELWANALYVSNYYYAVAEHQSPLRHTWSLAVEEQFYLLWPLLIYFFSERTLARFLSWGVPVLVLLAVAGSWLLFQEDVFAKLVVRGLPFRMLSLSVGAMFALRPGLLRVVGIGRALVLAAVMTLLQVWARLIAAPLSQVVVVFSVTGFSAFVFLAVYNAGRGANGTMKRVVEGTGMVGVGKISYGLYLYHYIILHYFGARDSYVPEGVEPGFFLFLVIMAFAVSVFSFRYLESPILRLKAALVRRNGF